MCIAPCQNKKRRTCPERLVWRCGCTSWEVQLAARSGPFSFASQPSGWFADSSVLLGCSCASYYTPPPHTYKSSVFVKFGICYKYSLFLVQFDWNGGGLSVIAAQCHRTGCGSQRPLRARFCTCVLLAAAPTTPPCFRHWRRSSLLPSRGGLGKKDRLCAMPRAPLLAGAVAARRLGGCTEELLPD